jgi:hypothetical protein
MEGPRTKDFSCIFTVLIPVPARWARVQHGPGLLRDYCSCYNYRVARTCKEIVFHISIQRSLTFF